MSNLDISELDPRISSAIFRPYIDFAQRVEVMSRAPKDGKTIYAWSTEEGWIPIYWDESRWHRTDGQSEWLRSSMAWDDCFLCWLDLPTITQKEPQP